MTDPTPLLVPMSLQALVVNAHVQGKPFQRWATNYANLNEFTDPVPRAFESVANQPPDIGVHLHWKLPSALTRGRGDATTGVEFDLTPNRWIVVRWATTANAVTAPQLTAWIVRSDYLGADGMSPYAHPFTSTSGKVEPTKIGKISKIEEWRGEPGGPLFLSATGIADVTFTAYQPGLAGVYSFFDDMNGVAENTILTYLVAGWYSDPSKDPLAKPTADTLNWEVRGTASPKPTLSVLHGMLQSVTWQTSRLPERVDSDAKSMQVGVGYTGVDALAAILAARAGQGSGSDIEKMLEAFQYDMLRKLDDDDGMAQLELRIREAWFGSTPGGTRWDLVSVSQGQRTDQALDRGTVPPPPPLTPAQATWLAALNVAQRKYDVARRDLVSAQWDLFALWWKQQRAHVSPMSRRQQNDFNIKQDKILEWINDALSPANPASEFNAVANQKKDVTLLSATVPDASSVDDIKRWSEKIPAGTVALMLKPTALPPFSHPADPVLVVAGITPPASDADDSRPLPCRSLDAAVTGVKVKGQNVTKTSGSLASIIRFPTTTALPSAIASAVNALSLEAFFAESNNAASIVRNGTDSTDAGTISALRDAMRNGTAQIATIAEPLRAGFAFAPWQQAWSPLYLQWELTWFPTVLPNAKGDELPAPEARFERGSDGARDNWPFDPSGWSFDGSDDVMQRGSEYYRWTGGDPWSRKPLEQKQIGRTFLTPHATFLLLRRLNDYVRLHPDDRSMGNIKRLIDQVGQTRFLSQALSGFNAGFLMRALRQSPPPQANTPIADAIGGENRGVPMVEAGDQILDFGGGRPFFFPVRGGFFRFERLIIVDAFGQVLNLLAANGNSVGTAENFEPIRGAGLVPDPGSGLPALKRLVRQAPRITQPSRLDLRLLDANDDAKEIFYSSATSPVCGWVLPNHLDHSLNVYDGSGSPLGEMLVLADVSGTPAVRWLPAPGAASPITDPARIPNKHLAATFSAFTAASGGVPAAQRVAAFRALLATIDETLWMVDPKRGDDDHDLAVLIGRPLALVRAQIRYELFGRPAQNQSWRGTLRKQTSDLGASRFPIRLGSVELLDDGLIGYFTDTTYTTFHAVHPSGRQTSPYVKAVAPGNYLSLPFDFPTYSTQNLTLLLDPRAKVHATTGVLPAATIELPSQFYDEALRQLAVTFRTGPVLTSPTTIRIPCPGEQNGDWTWIRRTNAGTAPSSFETTNIVASNEDARLEDTPPHLIDGWLKFVPEAKPRLSAETLPRPGGADRLELDHLRNEENA